jgi:hypothetical protein
MNSHLRRFWGLYCSCITLLVLVCVGTSGILIWNYWGRDASQGQEIPSSSGVTAGIIETSETVFGSQGEEGGVEEPFLRLSEGQAYPYSIERLPVATGETLSPEEIQRIINRLPDVAAEPTDQVDFNLPPDPVPPPRPGETISVTFPPKDDQPVPEPVSPGPLEVLRYAPVGEIPIAPFINITFNQPMVPIATIEDLAQENVPVIVEPELSGTWRWVGTKTLTFNHDSTDIDRLPMATEYRVTIPAGTQSATGSKLSDPVEFTFSTPPVQIVNHYPYSGNPQSLEPLIFVAFDQRIDPKSVLDTIEVTSDGSRVDVMLATDEDIGANKSVDRLVAKSVKDRWMVFKTKEPLPKDSYINVVIGPGTPSLEGPLLSQSAYSFDFRTYAPLKVVDHGCSWWDEKCPPLTPLYIEFNNPINADVYDPSMLRVDPEIPGVIVDIFGDTINIRGATQGQTTYTVFVSGEIQDIFGQKMGDDENLTFRVGPAEPVLVGPDEVFVTMDPAADEPAISLFTINYNKLDLQIYAVQPTDWPAFKAYLREYQQTDQHAEPPGKKVFDGDLRIEAPSDTLTEVGVDLSDYMDGDYGHFVVIAKPPKGLFQDDRYWEAVQVWVQITQIGLDALVDHSEMIVWTNVLQNGDPIQGTKISYDSQEVAVTTEEGTARFVIPADNPTYLIASKGADRALLPNNTYYWGDEGWNRYRPNDYFRWFVFDDRQMYRPGEDVTIKGWVRLVGGQQDGDVGLPGNSLTAVKFHNMGITRK